MSDAYTFARQRATRSGVLTRSELARLRELEAEVEAVHYTVEGCVAASGKPAIRVQARGEGTMACQRCLEPVRLALSADAELELAPTQAAIDAATDDVDRIVGSAPLDVTAVVEDELILGLPMVARHAEGQCPVAGDERIQ